MKMLLRGAAILTALSLWTAGAADLHWDSVHNKNTSYLNITTNWCERPAAIATNDVCWFTGNGCIAPEVFPADTLVVGTVASNGFLRLRHTDITVKNLIWNHGSLYGTTGSRTYRLYGAITLVGTTPHCLYVDSNTQNLEIRAEVSSEDDTPALLIGTEPKSAAPTLDTLLDGVKNLYTFYGSFQRYKGSFEAKKFGPIVFANDYPLGDPDTPKSPALTLQNNAAFAFDGVFAQSTNRTIFLAGAQAYLMAWQNIANGSVVRYPIAGKGTLIKEGVGTVTLACDYAAGPLAISNGTLVIDAAATFPRGQRIVVANGATLKTYLATNDFDVVLAEGATLIITGQQRIWTGQANDSRFSNAANWREGIVPREGDHLLFTASATAVNDLPGIEFGSVTSRDAASVFVSGQGLPAAAYCVESVGSELSVGGECVVARDGTLRVSGGGILAFAATPARRFCRLEVSDATTLKINANVTVRAAVLDLQDGAIDIAASGLLDAFSVVRLDGTPLAKGSYANYGGTLLVGTVPTNRHAHAQGILNALKALSATDKWLASWRASWTEEQTTFCTNDANGAWTPLPPSEVDLDANSSVYRVVTNHPYFYFLDFSNIAGTWKSAEDYQQRRAQLTGLVRAAYERWRGIPVFSWHFENPYVPSSWSSDPCRYLYRRADYPQEHRYMLREMLQNTGGVCGLGRDSARVARYAVGVKNPKRWFDERLDEIAAFIDTLRDTRGRRIPIVIRLLHECDDDWQCWGSGSTTFEDFKETFRYLAEGLRWRTNGAPMLFGYCMDRFSTLNEDLSDSEDYMTRYPGDDVVDIVGYDDYYIGRAEPDKNRTKEDNLALTIRRMQLLSAMAESHDKACGLFETGIREDQDPAEAYDWHYRAMTAEGCNFAFLNTWGGVTVPTNDVGKAKFTAYLQKDEVVSVNNGPFPFVGYTTDYFGGEATRSKPILGGPTSASCVAWHTNAALTAFAGENGAIVNLGGNVITPQDEDSNRYVILETAKMKPSTVNGEMYFGADEATFGTNRTFSGTCNPGRFTFSNLTLSGGTLDLNDGGTLTFAGNCRVAHDFTFRFANQNTTVSERRNWTNDTNLVLTGEADATLHYGVKKIASSTALDEFESTFTSAGDASGFKGVQVVNNAPVIANITDNYTLLDLTSATAFGSTANDANSIAVQLGNHAFLGLSAVVETGTNRAIQLTHSASNFAGVKVTAGETVTLVAPITESAALDGKGCFHKRGGGTLLLGGVFAPKTVVVDEGLIGTRSDDAVGNVTSWRFAKGTGIVLAKGSTSAYGLRGTIARTDETSPIPVTLYGYDSSDTTIDHPICTLPTPSAAELFVLTACDGCATVHIVCTPVQIGQETYYRYAVRLFTDGQTIPDTWATRYPRFVEMFGSDFTVALMKPTGKMDARGILLLVWQDYVAGTDPTDISDVFRASITIVNQKPIISYTPELDDAQKALRKYTVYGKVNLSDENWVETTEADYAKYHFFRMTVEMK